MRIFSLLLVLVAMPVQADDLGLKVPPNFKVTLWADHTLANDIYTMALDEKGRVVVSGPGYIRRLEDTDGDGKADKATDIAETKTGAMGLCFSPLFGDRDRRAISSDGQLRLETTKSSGERDYFWTVVSEWPTSEHGGHAVKIGPDRMAYAIAGNSTNFRQIGSTERAKLAAAEAGGIIAFGSNSASEVNLIAHGFRNPYDFDFTPLGDIITFDSDSERDYLLPWYTPTRVYHVMPGVHHGWRLPAGNRSLARRDYYPDTVPMLADLGRGSPTGVCCYRHTQFPAHYRGGVFLLDWTFGKIHYLPLIPEGSSYKQIKPELFLEPTGTNGFAPTAARVAPDGSLFISIGGRGTRGSVYRIEYLVDGKNHVIPRAEPENDIDKVLDAPQPLEAWSMAKWMPLAEGIASGDLESVIVNEREPEQRRIRAIEIHDMKQNRALTTAIVQTILKSRSELLRTLLARILKTYYANTAHDSLWDLCGDESPRVRCEALLSIGHQLVATESKRLINFGVLRDCLGDSDVRVRLASSRVAGLLREREVRYLELMVIGQKEFRSRAAMCVSRSWPEKFSPRESPTLHDVLACLEMANSATERMNAVRSMMLLQEDWNINSPSVELWAAYSLKASLNRKPGYERLLTHEALNHIRGMFPSKDERLNIEASRLLAMLEDDDPASIGKILAQIAPDTHPTWDFHYLIVLSRLSSPRTQAQSQQVADALLSLDAKLERRDLRVESNWPLRLRELVIELLRTHPGLDKLLVAHEKLVAPGHVLIASQLRLEAKRAAAGRFFEAVRDNPEFPLSGELVQLLATLPAEEIRPLLRSRWADRSVRDAIIKPLAAKPEEVDRAKFLEALETGQEGAVSLIALETLPRDPSPKNLVPLFARLRQALSDPKEKGIRNQLIALVNRQTGQAFAIEETNTPLGETYQPLFAWFDKTHPAEAKRLTTASEDEAAIRKMAVNIDWGTGNVARGIKVFDRLGCQACHAGSTRLGPGLAGSGKRLSRDDLLTAILNPSRDVAPIYRVTNIETKDNKRISGLITYDSREALLVQLGTGETKRIAGPDIESRTPSMKSLMPDGLLKGIKPEDLADLFAFLTRQ